MNEYDVSVFIVTQKNEIIDFQEYDNEQDSETIFVLITNDVLNSDYGENNSIYLYKHWFIQSRSISEKYGNAAFIQPSTTGDWRDQIVWQLNNTPIPNVFHFTEDDFCIADADTEERNDYFKDYVNGYQQCKDIMSNVRSLLDPNANIGQKELTLFLPAIMEAHNTTLDFNNKRYNGYLPAIGQLIYISKNVDKINQTMKKINGFPISYFDDYLVNDWFSCHEYILSSRQDEADVIVFAAGEPTHRQKTNHFKHVLVLYAIY